MAKRERLSSEFVAYDIYLITNNINGKQYVGQTIRGIGRRFAEHCATYESNCLITKAILKYGKDNFTVVKIDEASNQKELDDLEIKYIAKLNTLSPNGYNLTKGGMGGAKSLQTRQLMKITNKRKHTEATKEKLRNINLGKKLSDETKLKISLSGRGKKRVFTVEHRNNIGKSSKGRVFSPQALQRISESVSGSKNGMYGVKRDEAFKRAMSEKQRELKTGKPKRKLNEEQVLEIKKLLSAKQSITSIAKQYNVCFETISDIKKNKTWKHVIPEEAVVDD